jgi:hypothetical protein
MSASSSKNKSRELDPLEEACGEFRRFRIHRHTILVELGGSCFVVVPLSSKIARLVRNLRVGDKIGVLRTNDDTDPVRMRRL